MAISIGPEDYLSSATNETPSIEDVQGRSVASAASDYSRRKSNSYTPDGGDFELVQLQARLARSTNPLEQLHLEAEVNALASRLTGASPLPTSKQPARQSVKDEVIENYGQEKYDSTMTWAGEMMSDSVVASVNEILQQGTDNSVVAYQGLQELSGLSDDSFSSVEDVVPMDPATAHELSTRFGEAGEQLVTINEALASGVAKPADALKMALSNPSLRQAAIAAAREGLINIVL